MQRAVVCVFAQIKASVVRVGHLDLRVPSGETLDDLRSNKKASAQVGVNFCSPRRQERGWMLRPMNGRVDRKVPHVCPCRAARLTRSMSIDVRSSSGPSSTFCEQTGTDLHTL